MLELADEADSKSVGLITRAGSTPATGTNSVPEDGSLNCPHLLFCEKIPKENLGMKSRGIPTA